MRSLGDRWRAGRPVFLVLAGASVGFVANAVALGFAVALPPAIGIEPFVLFGTGMGLAAVQAVLASRSASQSARTFAILGVTATALSVLSYPGLAGGGLALVGAMWGIVQTYRPRP